MATSKTWTRTLDLDPEKPRPLKRWNLDPQKQGIKMGLKNMSDFRELCFIKTMGNVICSVNYCLMKILKGTVTKKVTVCFDNLGEENF